MDDPKMMKQPFSIDPRDASTPDAFVPRDSSMIRLTGKHPFNAGIDLITHIFQYMLNCFCLIRGAFKITRESWICHA